MPYISKKLPATFDQNHSHNKIRVKVCCVFESRRKKEKTKEDKKNSIMIINIEKIFMRRNMRRLLFNASEPDYILIRQNFGKSYGMCQIKSETKRQNKKKDTN